MFDILSVTTIAHLCIYTILLYLAKCNRPDIRNIFASITVAMIVCVLEAYNRHSGSYVHYHYLINFSMMFTAMVGPLFYYYTQSILGENTSSLTNKLIHTVPALCYLCIYIYLQLQGKESKFAYLIATEGTMANFRLVVDVIFNLITLFYFYLSFLSIRNFKKNWIHQCSESDLKLLSSSSQIIVSIIISFICMIITILFRSAFINIEFITVGLMFVIYLSILTKTVLNPSFLRNFQYIDRSQWCVPPSIIQLPLTYISSVDVDIAHKSQTTDTSLDTYNKLVDYMEKTHIYLQPKLNLEELAELTNTKKYLLSQAINNNTDFTFGTFINRYRIEETKRRLCDKQFKNETIESIGLECGFSSPSRFFDMFKKIEGLTPSQYRQKCESNNFKC